MVWGVADLGYDQREAVGECLVVFAAGLVAEAPEEGPDSELDAEARHQDYGQKPGEDRTEEALGDFSPVRHAAFPPMNT